MRSANNSVPKTKDGGNSIIGGGAEQWKPTGALNGMLFHFLNCFPFGIMYARHPLLQGLAKRIHTLFFLSQPREHSGIQAGLEAQETGVPPVGNELQRNPLFVFPPPWQA